MDNIIDAESKSKCAHEACECEVGFGQQYCSDYCSEADELDEVELQCDCGHAPCALNAAEAKGDEARTS
jgi:hypothetical protein